MRPLAHIARARGAGTRIDEKEEAGSREQRWESDGEKTQRRPRPPFPAPWLGRSFHARDKEQRSGKRDEGGGCRRGGGRRLAAAIEGSPAV